MYKVSVKFKTGFKYEKPCATIDVAKEAEESFSKVINVVHIRIDPISKKEWDNLCRVNQL